MSGENREIHDVAIVGFGPVGATLANLLAQDGLRVVALEREAGPYPLPRAVHFDDEVMRVFQTIGLADRIVPGTHVSPGMRFVDADGALLVDWSRPLQVGPLGWNISFRFHQPDLERVLRAGAASRNVDIHLRADVFAIDETGDAVAIRYEDLSNGALREVHARYVVGCDGARSLVRRLIGSGMEDLGFHERWLVVDALLKRPKPELGDFSVQYCDSNRPATYVRGVGDRRRWEISLMPGDDPQTISEPANVWALLRRWLTPDDAVLERAVCYTFHSTLATTWRKGRLLIAGDSAHQTPPFLGQGMCAGIRDAANLAWKLGRVLRGQADDALLDTYQTERLPHVRAYIELAVEMGGVINTTALASRQKTAPPKQMRTIKPRLGPGLLMPQCGAAGTIAPQPRLEDGRLLDDEVAYRFAAIVAPALDATQDLRAECSTRDIAIVADSSPAISDWLGEIGAHGALVRPDRYIMGVARTSDEMIALVRAIQ